MKKLIGHLVMAAMIASCTTSTAPSLFEDDGHMIASTTSDGLTLQVYADDALHAGYNALRLKVLKGTDIVRNTTIKVVPMMDMGTMQHSSPVFQPTSANPRGLYETGVIFTMAGTRDQWSLQCSVAIDGIIRVLEVPVDVTASEHCKVLKSGMQKTVVTMVTNRWNVGMNDVEFILHSSMDGFEYQMVTDAQLTMDPTMPSMGHGSAGNVSPTSIGKGWYRGRLNLTMSGDWSIQLRHVENEAETFKVTFNIVVP